MGWPRPDLAEFHLKLIAAASAGLADPLTPGPGRGHGRSPGAQRLGLRRGCPPAVPAPLDQESSVVSQPLEVMAEIKRHFDLLSAEFAGADGCLVLPHAALLACGSA
ncbi:hypothetical protein GCM10023075_35590 [Streptosporangium album]